MGSLSDLIAMGGYGAYVWPAYLVAAAVMIGLAIDSRRRIKRNEALLSALEASRGAGQSTGGDETPEGSNETPEGSNET